MALYDAENIVGKCFKDKYVVLKKIGEGGFGRVYLCENKYASSQRYALKMIPKVTDFGLSKRDVQGQLRTMLGTPAFMAPEVRAGKYTMAADVFSLGSIFYLLLTRKYLPGVATADQLQQQHQRKQQIGTRGDRKILDDFELDDAVFIVMEYCEEGSLKDFVTKHRGAPMHILLATDVLLQLVDALKLMHNSDIMHRDLTAGNVLVKEISRGQDGNVKRLHVKVTDFGLSKRDVQGQLRTMLGTPAFMAPEVRAGKYTMAADVFSLGSIFYLLLTRKYLPGVATADQLQQQHQRKQQIGTGGHHQQHVQLQQQQHVDLERIWSIVWKLNESVRALDSANVNVNVHGFLKSFLVGLLCREDNRIMLNEIDHCDYIMWYRMNRKLLDPEMDELCCSASISGTAAGGSGGIAAGGYGSGGAGGVRRLSRSGGVIGVDQQQVRGGAGAVLVDINRDSALGSDNPSRSGTSRCRHPQLDETGRCRTCSYRPTCSNRAPSLMDSGRPVAVASARVVLPSGRFENALPVARIAPPASAFSAPATINARGKENIRPPPAATLTNSASPLRTTTTDRSPWPLPTTLHLQNYVGLNEMGRCSFCRPGSTADKLHLAVIFEKTRSKKDNTVECIVELWRTVNGTAQELRLSEPISRYIPCPARGDPFVKKNDRAELLARARSADELGPSDQLARVAYGTLCGFYRLAESKINQAYCEEVVGDRKWRLELRWNGFVNVYEGARTARELDLKLLTRQKAERGQFEEVKGADPLSRADQSRLEELAILLRTEVNQSVWRRRQFESAGGGGQARNVRCTIYTRGYT
uniref:Protein kinase domain-containing protein n=1 Tax=Globodera pallida TaxID=36090 RepID=A0A183CAY8_GLOPA